MQTSLGIQAAPAVRPRQTHTSVRMGTPPTPQPPTPAPPAWPRWTHSLSGTHRPNIVSIQSDLAGGMEGSQPGITVEGRGLTEGGHC